jgi:glycosyltransferase involved in cell wall biosynthesis
LLKPTGGIPDFLADGKNGFFITDEPGDIAAKIRWMLEHPLERATMAREARATALRFSWEAVAQKYIHVLASLRAPRRAVIAGQQEQEVGA